MVRKVVLIAIYVLVVSALIFGIVLAFQKRAAAPPNTSANGHTATGPTAGPVANQPGTTAGSAASGAGTGAVAGSGGSTSASGVSADGQPLANSGPGSVVVLFVLSSLLGGLGFHAYQRHRSVMSRHL